MNESRIDEPGGQDGGPPPDALEAHEAERSLGAILAGDVNTVVVTTVSAVAGAYAVKRVLSREPDAKVSEDDGGQAPEADTPA